MSREPSHRPSREQIVSSIVSLSESMVDKVSQLVQGRRKTQKVLELRMCQFHVRHNMC